MYTNIMILLDIVFDQIIYEYSTCAEPVHLLLYCIVVSLAAN